MIVLGEKYKDSVSGIVGTVTAKTEYLYGCIWVLLEVDLPKGATELKEIWLDEQRLIPSKSKRTAAIKAISTKQRAGGMVSRPSGRSLPDIRAS